VLGASRWDSGIFVARICLLPRAKPIGGIASKAERLIATIGAAVSLAGPKRANTRPSFGAAFCGAKISTLGVDGLAGLGAPLAIFPKIHSHTVSFIGGRSAFIFEYGANTTNILLNFTIASAKASAQIVAIFVAIFRVRTITNRQGPWRAVTLAKPVACAIRTANLGTKGSRFTTIIAKSFCARLTDLPPRPASRTTIARTGRKSAAVALAILRSTLSVRAGTRDALARDTLGCGAARPCLSSITQAKSGGAFTLTMCGQARLPSLCLWDRAFFSVCLRNAGQAVSISNASLTFGTAMNFRAIRAVTGGEDLARRLGSSCARLFYATLSSSGLLATCPRGVACGASKRIRLLPRARAANTRASHHQGEQKDPMHPAMLAPLG